MAKEPSIEISPKYGVNPTRKICFFCGNETGEIVMLGRIRDKDSRGRRIMDSDLEAPSSMVLNYEPCDKCKSNMAMGISLIGVAETRSDKRPPIQKAPDGTELYPTGDWVVVKEEFIRLNFDAQQAEDIIKNKTCLVPNILVEELLNAMEDK